MGQDGVRLEADPRHAELIIKEYATEGGRETASPGEKGLFKKERDTNEAMQLNGEEATRYRAAVARLNYMCAERPDLQFSVKELARSMSSPCNIDVVKLRRLAKYLRGRPRWHIVYEWQVLTSELYVYTDSDCGGDSEARTSTSGGCMLICSRVAVEPVLL